MGRKCQPGVICIENVTLFTIIIIVLALCYLLYINSKQRTTTTEKIVINPNESNMFVRPNFGFTNIPGDTLFNPYNPPLKNSGYMVPNRDIRGAIPINIQTQGYNASYGQVGILTRVNGGEMILPLMGRPLMTGRDKWQYYCMSDQNIKLPVSNNGKSCTGEYGCGNLYNGDTIYVEGYNSVFKVTIYENENPRYIPVI